MMNEEFVAPSAQELRMKQANVVRKYFNKMQRQAMAIGAHDEYIIASRGTGKSEGIDARFILRNVWEMPGSLGALISPSYAKAWGNTLPAICKALAEWGYLEGVHYVVGHRAPASMGFRLPVRPLMREGWNNAFHFWNGTVMVVLSFNQGMSANSMSIDWVIGPEAKFLSYEKIKSEVNPANRGNRQYFGHCPHHHSVCYSTDMPTAAMGRWILDKREEMNTDHINLIRTLYKQLQEYRRKPLTEHVQRQIRELRRDLDIARRYQPPVHPAPGKTREYTVFYGEYDVFDNLEVLGEDYIWQMYRDSPPLVWRTAFLNERIYRVENGFYSALDEKVHFYTPTDSGRLQALGADWKRLSSSGCLGDGDLDFDAPLHLAFDSNASISTCCVGQKDGGTMRVLKSFYVKTPGKLQDLVKQVADYYRPKLKHEVVVYYDHTFTWETGASSESYADIIRRVLEENGYTVQMVYVGQAPRHDWKHLNIDRSLKGDPDFLLVRINLYNNEFLKIALEQTGVRQGKNGFEKDKTPEGTPDTPDTPDEYKTHITDAFDTLWLGMNFFFTEPGMVAGGAFFLR
ncbi:hypothetical protein Q3C19_15685 [Bacteroides sp. ET489]|uniref:hypothetical protein n=1 Tax=Bacteroides sp. ET489 TaxID=3057126 RepID=UPI002671FF7B|nr:hypothetical protein [Bacteroides sp. ET489]MDO3391901.1 hypothetical protein [Bacteroides sp. ET489]